MRFFVVIFSALFLSSASARIGNETGNGGDTFALEFIRTAEWLSALMKYNGIQAVYLDELKKAVARAKVESTDKPLKVNGVPKDAINYPTRNAILFNRKRWQEMGEGDRAVLVLHEYLSLVGVESANYEFSRRILDLFDFRQSNWLDCTYKDNGGGRISLGIDETAGMDTILIGVHPQKGSMGMGLAMRPVGEFSKMVRNGSVSLALDDNYLVSLIAGSEPFTLNGHIAMNGKVVAIDCHVRKFDPRENYACELNLEASPRRRF